ncbi:MAG: outer membrane protein assembly factor BamC [Gammaproteobacteria bacterium]|jgi:outer membrane protein assembly factor BamC|nr:outer membrane protein assembly factor BamC [Gammaproteobacteria bacterium]MBT3860404.1 outer membrane protein assembly factor BamC [Gammaproteobacteria bacterium]MBT3986019.1 outer membrane protein assembly factor BamC [Gammaproteobacteria bacterium]MBT4256424.1 outer membrane protein assembly factor BamC [Gammaproteobacteria bacterium]MBT4582381.1 outer membrane protein assembly factor BamC [Gammaproteobacteria bacterium]
MIRILSVALLAVALQGCNYLMGDDGMFPDRSDEYAKAPVTPIMSVPEDLDSYTLDQLYVVPAQISSTATAFEEIPLPTPLETRRQEGVIIQNLGDKEWVVIDATPGQVWPLVRDFWTQLQVILDYENPGTGTMETSWLEVDSDQEMRHKYRVTIEPGLHSGYSEIYILHMEDLRSEPEPIILTWPEASNSGERENQIMTNLSQYLADRNDVYQASSASLLAGSIEAERKANIIDSEQGGQLLTLRMDFNRAWVQVRQAIEEADIAILETDRDERYYNVRFSGIEDDEEDTGFIGRLFGGSENEAAVEEQDFVVRFQESGGIISVEATAIDSSSDLSQLTAELLQVINDNLG